MADNGLKDIFVTKDSLFGKFLHEDIKVSEEEEEKAIELLRKAKQQKKNAQQAHFASYLPKSSAGNF